MKNNSISTFPFAVVIPVYNHGRTVAEVVRRTASLGFGLFVVDDGSTDLDNGRLSQISDCGARLLRHGVNRGKGAALLTGFRAAAKAGFPWAITLDADGQHIPEECKALIQAIPAGSRPIVVGRRMGMLDAGAPWTSRFGRGFSNFWIRCSGGPATTDTQSGFRIYPLPEVLTLNIAARRYQFELEILVKAAWRGIPVIETPISVIYRPDGGRISHFHPFLDFLRNTGTFTRLIVARVFGRARRSR
ncbi:Glycosyl transferase [Desulfosarcina cetonica]|uniref:glycosyltransferase family 2 protein n=1 Tax=Desulfosarcina cetonica TaxID=90730 RepID=UPI0006CFF90A|nr:glycosyltransferase family 2 protein [Desulfosarcina cetonica]VTR70701.1 Glycosyl transferase [Desulfosarcina cetonica]